MAKPAETESPATPAARKSASTVVVACKIPTGLELQLCHKTDWTEETPSGSRDRFRWDRGGPTVRIRGTAYPAGATPRGFPERPQMAGGYALTYGVDREFFETWMEQNKLNPIVVSNMVFAFDRSNDTKAQAKEFKDIRSGLEPLNPDDDPRMPKPLNANLSQIETADEMAGRQALPAEVD